MAPHRKPELLVPACLMPFQAAAPGGPWAGSGWNLPTQSCRAAADYVNDLPSPRRTRRDCDQRVGRSWRRTSLPMPGGTRCALALLLGETTQIPCGSPRCAKARHSRRTGQPAQIAFAAATCCSDAPVFEIGKNSSGSADKHAAPRRQSASPAGHGPPLRDAGTRGRRPDGGWPPAGRSQPP